MSHSFRVTLFGNVNNEMYRFAVALKQHGITVKLVTLEEGKLHDPSSINSSRLDSNDEILHTGLNDVDLLSISKDFRSIVISETSESDFAIFTGATIAFANFTKAPYSLFLSGSDAILMTSYLMPLIRIQASPKRVRGFLRYFLPMSIYVFLQRRSIKRSRFWLSLPEKAFSELNILKSKLRCTNIFQTFLPVVLDNQIKTLGSVSDGLIKVLLVGRFFKKNGPLSSISLDDKGSSIALAGILQFARSHPNVIEFAYFSKGQMSDECLSLINDLREFCSVVEKTEMTFDEFLIEISSSEVIIDSVGPSPVARNSIEALSLGKFVIGNFLNFHPLDNLPNDLLLKTLTHSAISSDGVLEGLEIYQQNRSDFLKIAPEIAIEISDAFSPKNQGAKLIRLIQSYTT
jgi:hypothetical protein